MQSDANVNEQPQSGKSWIRWLLRLAFLYGAIFVAFLLVVGYLNWRAWRSGQSIKALEKIRADVKTEKAKLWGLIEIRRPISLSLSPVKQSESLPAGIEVSGLKSLWIGNYPISASQLRSLCSGGELTSLGVSSDNLIDDDIKRLSNCPKLQSLSLSGSQLTGTGMSAFHGSPLVTLDLSNSSVTDEGMQAAGAFKRLQKLNLGWTKISDTGLRVFRDLSDLDELSINTVPCTGEGFAELRATKLRTLDARRSMLNDAGLKFLVGSSVLERVELNETQVTGIGLEAATSNQLHRLSLYKTPANDAGAEAISRIASLKSLSLNETKITDSGMGLLGRLKVLEDLQVPDTAITSEGFRDFGEMLNLTDLAAANTKFSGEGVTLPFPNMRFVDLSNCPVTDGGLACLASCQEIQDLYLGKSQVTGKGFAAIQHVPIHSIDLSDSAVTDEGLRTIAQLKGLETINLSRTKTTVEGVRHLRGASNLFRISFADDFTEYSDETKTPDENGPADAIVDVLIQWPHPQIPHLAIPDGEVSLSAIKRLEAEGERREAARIAAEEKAALEEEKAAMEREAVGADSVPTLNAAESQ